MKGGHGTTNISNTANNITNITDTHGNNFKKILVDEDEKNNSKNNKMIYVWLNYNKENRIPENIHSNSIEYSNTLKDNTWYYYNNNKFYLDEKFQNEVKSYLNPNFFKKIKNKAMRAASSVKHGLIKNETEQNKQHKISNGTQSSTGGKRRTKRRRQRSNKKRTNKRKKTKTRMKRRKTVKRKTNKRRRKR